MSECDCEMEGQKQRRGEESALSLRRDRVELGYILSIGVVGLPGRSLPVQSWAGIWPLHFAIYFLY